MVESTHSPQRGAGCLHFVCLFRFETHTKTKNIVDIYCCKSLEQNLALANVKLSMSLAPKIRRNFCFVHIYIMCVSKLLSIVSIPHWYCRKFMLRLACHDDRTWYTYMSVMYLLCLQNMYLEYATTCAVPGGLFSIYQNLGIQIHHFLHDDYRCVFTFDRLECNPNTDLIIELFCQDTDLSEKQTKQRVLLSLHLDYFYDYERRFGFRVVYNGPVATLMLFKNKQLRCLWTGGWVVAMPSQLRPTRTNFGSLE